MHGEFGYMESDHLGRPYDLGLLSRLAAFMRPQMRGVVLAALTVLLGVGLELLMPYLTRLAIDDYIVRQALAVRVEKASLGDLEELREEGGAGVLSGAHGLLYVPEKLWRGLDPRLTQRLRGDGAVEPEPYYVVADDEAAREVAGRHASWFRSAGGRLVISSADMRKLDSAALVALREPDAWGVGQIALLLLAVSALACSLGYGQHMLLERAGQEMMYSIRQRLYGHLLGRSLEFFGQRPVGKLVTRLTNDVQNLNEMFRTTLVAFFRDILSLVGIMAVLLLLDVTLALLCMSLIPLIAILAWVFARLAREAFRAMQGQLGRINALLSETLAGLMVVKLLGAEKQGFDEFERQNQKHYAAGMKQIKVFAVFLPMTELFAGVAAALILWYGGGQVIADRISLGTLVAFIFYMQLFFRPVRDIAEKYNILQAAMASAERIFHLMDNDQALAKPMEPPAPAQPGPGQVSFVGVSFGYDPAKPVVRKVDFVLPAGERWAVVGPTGAGKTTLVNLLMRFADPQEGRVLIDGVDLRRLDRSAVAARVSLVPQEVFLFAGTLEDNISLGRPGVDQADLRRALEVSGAEELVRGLPEGLSTELGEGARRLSAGQRQLLALARALAGNPPVLVLDEATSSVDPVSERLIQKALPRVMSGRTSLVVAHRLSTVRQADNILVMQSGEIVEQGRHEDLMAMGGLYARLVRLDRLRQKEHSNGSGT